VSNQFLLTICNWLTIIGALFALLGAVGRPYFSKQIEQEKDAQHTNTIGGLNTAITTSQQALEAERDKVVRLERENAVIRSLGVELQVEFQGNWKEYPFPLQVLSVDKQFYVYLKSSHKSDISIIKLHAAEPYEQKETQPGKGTFQAMQNVKIGQFPLGDQRDLLLSYDIVGIHIPFIQYERFITPEITIDRVILKFVLNGVSLIPLTLEQHVQAPVRIYGNNKSVAWASHEYPHVSIPWPQAGSTAVSKP
jgi:hypothetical protein